MFNPNILVGFPAGYSVEIGGFSTNQPPRLIPGYPKPAPYAFGQLVNTVTPKKPLGQGGLHPGHKARFLLPTPIPEGFLVPCPGP